MSSLIPIIDRSNLGMIGSCMKLGNGRNSSKIRRRESDLRPGTIGGPKSMSRNNLCPGTIVGPKIECDGPDLQNSKLWSPRRPVFDCRNARFTKIIKILATVAGKEKIGEAEAAMLCGGESEGRILNQNPVFIVILLNFVSLSRKEGQPLGGKVGFTIPSSMSVCSSAAQTGTQISILMCTRS